MNLEFNHVYVFILENVYFFYVDLELVAPVAVRAQNSDECVASSYGLKLVRVY